METYSERPKTLSNRANKLIMDALIVSNSSAVVAAGNSEEVARKSFSRNETSSAGNSVKGQKSFSRIETSTAEATAALLGVKVMAAEMPAFMQVHAVRCARRAHDGLDKFSSRQIAHDIKKEFDKVYGPTWHCIVGMSFGSFVTHSRGCFIYFSMDKIIVMLFKTGIRVKSS